MAQSGFGDYQWQPASQLLDAALNLVGHLKENSVLAWWMSWLEHLPHAPRLQVRSPVMAQASISQ